MTPGPGIEPGTHWWKASALTTTPTLLPRSLLYLAQAVLGALFLLCDFTLLCFASTFLQVLKTILSIMCESVVTSLVSAASCHQTAEVLNTSWIIFPIKW